MDVPFLVFLLSGVIWATILTLLFRVVSKTADDLYKLFLKDKERWWLESELRKRVGRSDFVTTFALMLLHDKVGLQFLPYLAHVRGKYRPIPLIRLDNDGRPRKRRKDEVKVVRTKRMNRFGQIPTYS